MDSTFWLRRVLPLALGLGLLGAGCVALDAVVLEPLRYWRHMQGWPETDCRILRYDSEILYSHYYRQNVTYEVRVPGRGRYEAHRVDVLNGEVGAARSRDRYAPGSRVPCWYDPEDPHRAVLFRTVPIGPALGGGLLLLAFLGGGGLFVVGALVPDRRG